MEKMVMDCDTGELSREPLTHDELEHRTRDRAEAEQAARDHHTDVEHQQTIITRLADLLSVKPEDIRRAFRLGGGSAPAEGA
jgi:hypothetical protein